MLAVLAFALGGCGLLKPKVEINHKIVGRWSTQGFVGEPIIWDFKKDGEMIFSMNGKQSPAQTYRIIDDATVELETKSGTKSTIKLVFSDNDNTMTTTDDFRFKTTFKRE